MNSFTARGGRLCLAVLLSLVAAGCLVPLAFLFVHSLSHWNATRALFFDWPNLDAYRVALQPDRVGKLWTVVRRSFLIASLELIVALPFSWILVRRSPPHARRLVLACITVPFFCSPFVRGFGWRLILQQNGPIGEVLSVLHLGPTTGVSFAFNEYAVWVALFSGTFAFALFPVLISMSQIPTNIWRASESCGAERLIELTRIALPLSQTSLALAWSSAFLMLIGSSAEVWLVGGSSQHSLSTSIAELFDANQLPSAFALGLIAFLMSGISAVVIAAAVRFLLGPMPPARATRTDDWVVRSTALEKAFVAIVMAVCVLPLLGIVLLSVTNGSSQHPWRFSGLSLASYLALPTFSEAKEALITSLKLSVPVAFATSAAALLFAISWWLGLSRRLLFAILFASACMPADIHALGLVAVYKMLGGTRGAWWLLAIAMVTWCLPFATAIIVSALSLVPKSLLEASSDLGASFLVTTRSVILALILPSVISAAIISILLCINEFGRTFYLSGGSEYLSEFLKGRFEAGLDPRAYSLAAMMVVTAALVWAFVLFAWQRTVDRVRRSSEAQAPDP